MRVGFIGLGQMGKPMALNLLKSGAELTAVNRVTDPFPELEARGARTSPDVADAAELGHRLPLPAARPRR